MIKQQFTIKILERDPEDSLKRWDNYSKMQREFNSEP